MKYAVVYVGCQIVEADSEEEAMEMFHEENHLYEAEEFCFAEPCYSDMYYIAEEMVVNAAEQMNR